MATGTASVWKCVQGGYNYEKAFQNTVELVRQLMKETGIPASKVYRHLDICSKNCPSQIIAKGDWTRFKKLISSGSSESSGNGNTSGEEIYKPGVYKVNDTELNIRIAPNADSKIVGVIRDQGSYTITKIQNGSWGKLLSGAGWINCHKNTVPTAVQHPLRSRPKKRSQLTEYGDLN